jgi:hypothetical protein
MASRTTNKPIVINGVNQLVEIANDSTTGKSAPTHGPT